MESNIAIAFDDVSKRFGKVDALKDISTTFVAGEVVGLIGPNGAGKSTLAQCLAGQLEPDSGRITFENRPFRPQAPADARALGVRLVQQELDIFPGMTVAENWRLIAPQNVALPSLFDGQERLQAEQLPAAQVQRLFLQAALAARPKLLILDEPTALLGEREGAHFIETLKDRLRPDGVALVSTHRLSDLSSFDRWLFLREGVIAFDTRDRNAAISFFLDGDPRAWPRIVVQPAAEPTPGDKRTVRIERSRFGSVDVPLVKGGIVGLAAPFGGPLYAFAKELAAALRTSCTLAYLGPERRTDHVFPHLSIAQHIQLNLGNQSAATHRFEGLCHQLELDLQPSVLDQRIETLSGGTQQRLFVALALAKDADIRIFCDPLRGVDRYNSRVLIRLLSESRVTNVVTFLAGQDEDLAYALADEMLLLKPNEVQRLTSLGRLKSVADLRAEL